VIKVRKFQVGYETRTEIYDDSDCGGSGRFEMKTAYTPSGDYIGSPKLAHMLCSKYGIAPELASKDNSVCSIGYSAGYRKWYGWSHRAFFGFNVGSTCRLGDCHYQASNPKEFAAQTIEFWFDENIHEKITYKMHNDHIILDYVLKENVKSSVYRDNRHDFPKTWGRGEWVARTMDDAKQMAIDFAEGVS